MSQDGNTAKQEGSKNGKHIVSNSGSQFLVLNIEEIEEHGNEETNQEQNQADAMINSLAKNMGIEI